MTGAQRPLWTTIRPLAGVELVARRRQDGAASHIDEYARVDLYDHLAVDLESDACRLTTGPYGADHAGAGEQNGSTVTRSASR